MGQSIQLGASLCMGFNAMLSANPGREAQPFLRMELAVSGNNTCQRKALFFFPSFLPSFLPFSLSPSLSLYSSLSVFQQVMKLRSLLAWNKLLHYRVYICV